jgi:ComEC/Rec2-related protein
MREKLRAGLDDRPQSSALLAAMLFGERDGLNDDQIRQFEVTGTLHLFAVSGQNIQLIALVMMVVLYALGLIRWRWGWLMITPLFIFVISTGMESSAVRAFLMASLVWISFVLYRPAQPLNILAGSALLIWVVDPRQLFDLGFQFSFLVVLGLVLFAPASTGLSTGASRLTSICPGSTCPFCVAGSIKGGRFSADCWPHPSWPGVARCRSPSVNFISFPRWPYWPI